MGSIDQRGFQAPQELSVEEIKAKQAQEARFASLNKLSGALESSNNPSEFWNKAQNELTDELESADGWQAMADYMRAQGGPGAASSVEAAKNVANLYKVKEGLPEGSDMSAIDAAIQQQMLVAETAMQTTFQEIYNREKPAKPENRPELKVVEGGAETTQPIDFRSRITEVAESNGLDLGAMAQEKALALRDFTTKLAEGGNRTSPKVFESMADGVRTFLKNGDNAYAFAPGRMDVNNRQALDTALQALRKQAGAMRSGPLREEASRLFADIEQFRVDNGF